MTNAIKVLLQMTSVSLQPVPILLKVCLNCKFAPTLHYTLEIEMQPATLFGEKCVRLYL
jgi:hypothetical protein